MTAGVVMGSALIGRTVSVVVMIIPTAHFSGNMFTLKSALLESNTSTYFQDLGMILLQITDTLIRPGKLHL